MLVPGGGGDGTGEDILTGEAVGENVIQGKSWEKCNVKFLYSYS